MTLRFSMGIEYLLIRAWAGAGSLSYFNSYNGSIGKKGKLNGIRNMESELARYASFLYFSRKVVWV